MVDCITAEALRGLQPGASPATYEGMKVFIPAPFVQQVVIQSGSSCPIELSSKVRMAYTEHIEDLDPSLVDATDAHMELFKQFCLGCPQQEVDDEHDPVTRCQ